MSGPGKRKRVRRRTVLPKLPAEEVLLLMEVNNPDVERREFGSLDAKCYCLHCDGEMSVRSVLAVADGDWCTATSGCDGAGFHFDLYGRRWWR